LGCPLAAEVKAFFPPKEAGDIFPAPASKKSARYDSKRAGLASGPWKHLAIMPPFSKNKSVTNFLLLLLLP